ncbi:MAG TPA: PQQ-binding-like beta-propeller repeat protein [Gemmataceae bacterium]|nr:PQQ-binding-like beta-propeller repeat protein [Gemmataceae bacterium]
MTSLPRTVTVRVALAVLSLMAAPAVSLAQVQLGGPPIGTTPALPPPPLGGPTAAEMFPQNQELARQIQQTAPQYIAAAKRHERDWFTVADILQPILNSEKDFLLKKEQTGLDGKPILGPDGKPIIYYTSGRAEAERLLASVPPDGLAAYRLRFGAKAQILLAQARANPALLDETARRYYLTDAGAEALTRLGLAELDNGHPDEAADRFRRLVERPDAAELPPLSLFQAALAFHAVGDAARESQTIQLLGRRLPPGGLQVGGQALSLNDLRREISRWPVAAAVASADSLMFRGDSRRTGHADGEFPQLDAHVRIPLVTDELKRMGYDRIARALAPAASTFPTTGPELPGFVPLAVGGKIIYRGPDGLHALDAETGKPVWQHAAPPGRPSLSLAALLKDDNQRLQLLHQWLPKYGGLPSLLDENATLGTLSSDGRHVFYIEDVPVPANPNDVFSLQQQLGQPGAGRPYFSSLEETLYHNRLRAVDAATGEFRWEVGGWDRAPNRPPAAFANVFFLGPPLPVGRRLFALVEQTAQDQIPARNKDIILLCLDPDTGRLLWSQDIAAASDPLWLDAARRMQPVHLAYGDGVLVCPTNTGCVVALDPLTHDLLWASVYHEPQPNPNGFPGFDPNQYETAWKGCCPIIQGDRVVLTAPDGETILCLNLRNGATLWSAQRTNDDVYVAGVFSDPPGGDKVLVVGSHKCRALNLATGEEIWKDLKTGAPAGFGTACGKYYLLPLRDGGVFGIDMNNPNLSTELEGVASDAPGNLVFHHGDLWSQSAKSVTAYRRLSQGLGDAASRLAKNPKDAAARIERGKLLFGQLDFAAAVEDWRAALENNPPAELAGPTRARLFKGLSLLLWQHFADNERFLGQYESLCLVTPPSGAKPEEVRAAQTEQRRRQINMLAIVAHGREVQGRSDLALQAYKQILEVAVGRDRIDTGDDPLMQSRPDLWTLTQVRPDVWVQGRIADLVKGAPPDQQTVLKNIIDQDWRTAQAGGEAALTRFIAQYGAVAGPLGAPAREARLLLADRWLNERDRRHALDAELQLRMLRDQADSPESAAAAQYAWARLLTQHGLLADAVEAYRGLARDFPTVRLPDGRTGAAALADLAVDKRFIAYLDDPLAGRPVGKMTVTEIEDHNNSPSGDLSCEPSDGVRPPSCRNLRFGINPQTYALKVVSTDGSCEPWSIPLPVPTEFLQQLNNQWAMTGAPLTSSYEADDHFLVIALGPILVGVDRIERRARWVRSLLPSDLPAGVQIAQLTPVGDGSVYMQTSDGAPVQRLGLIGSIGPNGVLIQTRGGIASLDVSGGDLRWLRAETAPTLTALGDADYLYIVDTHPNTGDAFGVRAIRTADGAATRIPSALGVYTQRLRSVGRCILASEGGGDDGAPLQVRFCDLQTGKDVWKATFPPHSRVLDSPQIPELTAVLSPDPASLPRMAASSVGLLAASVGQCPLTPAVSLFPKPEDATVTVVDLTAGREAAKLSVDGRFIEQLQQGAILRDRTQYYLVFQAAPDAKAVTLGPSAPNFIGAVSTAPVNGFICAYDRTTGQQTWATHSAIEQQVLLLDRFEDSSVLLMTALQSRQTPGVPGGNPMQVASTISIDKRTGMVAYRKDFADNNAPDQFFRLDVDARTGTVDLVNSSMRLHHAIEPAGSRKSD